MAKTKAEKAVIIEKLEKGMKDASSAVFVHFSKLSVADETAMRRSLRAEGVTYTVAKKTLIRRALNALGHLPAPGEARQAGKHEELPLEGEVAVAMGFGDDVTASARFVHEASKKLADKLSVIGGIFQGKLIGQAAMQEIATIPSMQVLRGMFVNIINSPIQGLAVALNAIAQKKS